MGHIPFRRLNLGALGTRVKLDSESANLGSLNVEMNGRDEVDLMVEPWWRCV